MSLATPSLVYPLDLRLLLSFKIFFLILTLLPNLCLPVVWEPVLVRQRKYGIN
jgi:hypothetical protein